MMKRLYKLDLLKAPSLWMVSVALCVATCTLGENPSFAADNANATEWVIENATIHTVGKNGTLQKGTILVKDGKIVDVGEKVVVPITARRIDGTGKHVLPGFVGLFYPVQTASGSAGSGEARSIVIGRRSFPVSGGSPASTTPFTLVSESIALDSIDWLPPHRLGVTTLQWIAPGYCQAAIVRPGKDRYSSEWIEPRSQLVLTLTNNPASLDLLRNNLKDRSQVVPTSGPPGDAAASSMRTGTSGAPGRGIGSGGRRVGGPSSPTTGPNPDASGSTRPAPELTPEQKLWKEVRDGERALWLNVNNAASILYAMQILADYPKVKVVWIANGPDVYQALKQIPTNRSTIALAPQLDTVPNTRNRMNVPALVSKAKMPLALSIGLRSTEMTRAESAPMFAYSILNKTGLPENETLRALTLTPAELLGIQKDVGSLETGKQANMILLDAAPFETVTQIENVYFEGRLVYENK